MIYTKPKNNPEAKLILEPPSKKKDCYGLTFDWPEPTSRMGFSKLQVGEDENFSFAVIPDIFYRESLFGSFQMDIRLKLRV